LLSQQCSGFGPAQCSHHDRPGLSYDSLGNHSQAAIYYNRVLSSPDDIHYLASKGVAADSLGDHVEAIRYFNQALKINPNDLYANAGMGVALVTLKNFTGAMQLFDMALKILC
jgi:tetratricopeptide (TPR) repeat protein